MTPSFTNEQILNSFVIFGKLVTIEETGGGTIQVRINRVDIHDP